jgi:hypothetical protein
LSRKEKKVHRKVAKSAKVLKKQLPFLCALRDFAVNLFFERSQLHFDPLQ